MFGIKDIIGPGLGLIGDIFGSKESADSAARQQAANTAAQKEFAQHGIRWKVEDAKAAGLHPLYALGAAGASYAPNPVVVNDGLGKAMSNAGQNLANAVARQQTADQHKQQELQNEMLLAQIDKERALADYYRSQSPVVTPGVQVFPYTGGSPAGDMLPGYPLPPRASSRFDNNKVATGGQFDKVTYKPNEHKSARSGDPHITPGKGPALSEYHLSGKRSMLLPHTFSDDAEIPAALLPSIIQANVEKYGFMNTLRAFGFGEGQTDDPISSRLVDWLGRPSVRPRSWLDRKPGTGSGKGFTRYQP